MKAFLLPVAALLSVSAALAQTPAAYRIEGQIRGLRDSTVRLAHYFGQSQYIVKDTARIDSGGRFVFTGTKPLPQGLYLVIPPTARPRYLDLVVSKPFFSFQTDTANYVSTMRVTGSPDNAVYYAYLQQRQRLTDEARAVELQAQLRADDAAKQMARQQLAVLNRQAATLQQTYLAKNDSLLALCLIRAGTDPVVPPAPRQRNGLVDSTFQYRYYKNHYWDTFDFTDERLVRSPIFQRKIDRYLRDLTTPTVDSLVRAADLIVAKASVNNELMAYAIWYITSQYERPRLMGTDGVFVHMAETYYLAGRMPTTDSSTVKTIRKRVETLRPLLVGKPFPALTASDTLRQAIDFQKIKANYTVLYFYGPTCSYCRESMPGLKKYADEVQGEGIRFCAIAVDNSPDAWQAFIREFGLQGWVNGYDFSFRTNYRQQFDVLKTPTVYVLDANKTILARALPAEQVPAFIRFQQQTERGMARK